MDLFLLLLLILAICDLNLCEKAGKTYLLVPIPGLEQSFNTRYVWANGLIWIAAFSVLKTSHYTRGNMCSVCYQCMHAV